MKKLLITIIAGIIIPLTVSAQDRYYTRNGHIDFFSHSPLEDIKADNEQAAVFLNITDGSISAAMLMKSFVFEKALMQQHFNENYIESDEFPRSEFDGKIEDFSTLDFKASAMQKVTATGKITLHGITRDISINGTIGKKAEKYRLDAKFNLRPSDFDIRIPSSKKDNIAEEIEVTLSAQLIAM